MCIMTSYYSRLRAIKSDPLRVPVAISVGVPVWYDDADARMRELAPTWSMLSLSRSDYERQFQSILSKLDPDDILRRLPKGAVMLCWEYPGRFCHRRIVAEWLEQRCGIEVPEYGIPRDKTPSVADSVWSAKF